MKRVAAVALLLGAALASATPSGHKWFLSTTKPSIAFQVFAHNTINHMPAGSFTAAVGSKGPILSRIQVAFHNWTCINASDCAVACTSWKSNYTGTFTTPTGTAAVNGNDGKNNVIYLGGTDWRYSNATLGLTTTLYFPNTGEIIDADMELNNNTQWDECDDPSTFNFFDYESVVIHEAGHFLGLDHTTNDGTAVMFPTVPNGSVKRTLRQADLSDVCTVYPSNGSSGGQGSPCTATTQCTSGLVCRGAVGATSKICTVDCTTNANACTTVPPLTCQTADTGKACLVPPASSDYCKFCTDGTQCSSGLCLQTQNGLHWCGSPCTPSTTCPTGSICADLDQAVQCSTASARCSCVPSTLRCPNQCTGTTCSAPGFVCNAGTCEPSGNEGDRCDDSTSYFCKTCKLCIQSETDPNFGYCRGCCGGQNLGGSCTACAPMTCATGQSCVPLSGSNDKVCYPSSGTGADICQACSATTPCLNGATCVGGKCHASCSPTNPGTCTACLPNGTSGLCACPGETSAVGGPCGTNPFHACSNGVACVNGICQQVCQVGVASSCPQGQVCRNTTGTPVCEPDVAGQRCASCNGLTCAPGNTCYQGRCYATCNVNVKPGPCDSSCVDVGGGTNVCACDDQIHGAGEACGSNPIAACADRLFCIGGRCLGECNPNTPTCPLLTECKLLAGTAFTFVCQPIDNTGTGGGGGTNPLDCTSASVTCPTGTTCTPNGDGTATCRADGVACDPNSATNTCPTGQICRAVDGDPNKFTCQTPSTGNDPGCGCNSGLPGAFVLLAAALLRRRRRS